MENEAFNIGQHIQEILRQKNRSTAWLAEQIPCDRSNIYNIFRRNDINSELLQRISVVLEHDFFADLSAGLRHGQDQMGGVFL